MLHLFLKNWYLSILFLEIGEIQHHSTSYTTNSTTSHQHHIFKLIQHHCHHHWPSTLSHICVRQVEANSARKPLRVDLPSSCRTQMNINTQTILTFDLLLYYCFFFRFFHCVFVVVSLFVFFVQLSKVWWLRWPYGLPPHLAV